MRDTQGSDLPRFTPEESELLRNTTIDFFSVNFYTGYYIWAPPKGAPKNQVGGLISGNAEMRTVALSLNHSSDQLHTSLQLSGCKPLCHSHAREYCILAVRLRKIYVMQQVL